MSDRSHIEELKAAADPAGIALPTAGPEPRKTAPPGCVLAVSYTREPPNAGRSDTLKARLCPLCPSMCPTNAARFRLVSRCYGKGQEIEPGPKTPANKGLCEA